MSDNKNSTNSTNSKTFTRHNSAASSLGDLHAQHNNDTSNIGIEVEPARSDNKLNRKNDQNNLDPLQAFPFILAPSNPPDLRRKAFKRLNLIEDFECLNILKLYFHEFFSMHDFGWFLDCASEPLAILFDKLARNEDDVSEDDMEWRLSAIELMREKLFEKVDDIFGSWDVLRQVGFFFIPF